MKKSYLVGLLLLIGLQAHAQYIPSKAVMQTRTQFQDDKFGIFIHWGIYSMLGNGEWVQNNKNLNYQEYTHLADGFYPSRFNADEWVRAIKEAGARYITITSRHHDGFSMFQTAEDTFNVADGTPYARDILKEIAEACQRHGIRLHLYYSHLDWHRTDYPLGRTGRKLGRPSEGTENWDSYLRFMKNQLRELLTNYGPIGCIWFDGWWDHDSDPTAFDWCLPEQYELIHQLQPACMVANNHHQAIFPGEDIQIFEQDLPGENTWGYSGQAISNLPLETCMTMNASWGYDITDKNYKSAEEIIRSLVRAAGRNANLLLNIGPRPDGLFPDEAMERLQAVGQWLQKYGTTIYSTRQGLLPPQPWGVTTQRDKTLYVHILNHGQKELYLPLGKHKIHSAILFDTREKLHTETTRNGVVLQLPSVPSGTDTVVEVLLK